MFSMKTSVHGTGLAILTAAILMAGPVAGQTTYVQDFEAGVAGGWTFGIPSVVETAGGNPDGYLHVTALDTFAPQPRTEGMVPEFTGDYRAAGVTAVGVDLITLSADFGAAGRPLSLILVNDNGTPGNTLDDFAAFYFGVPEVPEVGTGWASFDFDVPSQETSLPAGWALLDYSGAGMPNGDWNDVITNVTQVRFFYGHPEWFFIFQQWELGMDNVRITTEASGVQFLRGDADADGSVNPLVDGLTILNYGFVPGSAVPPCLAAADTDGDHNLNPLVDGLHMLNFGFVPGSPPVPAPFPSCGEDAATTDALGCDDPSGCP